MHDVDRTTLEYGNELYEYGESPLASEQYEYSGEQGSVLGEILGEAEGAGYEGAFEGGYQELPLPEIMEDELAAELMEIRSDQELDHFLGSLISRAVSTVRKAVGSPLGQALTGILRQVGKKVLPIAGGALGTLVGGPAGGMIGGKLASMAGDAFGLEAEGLSPEDRDFEVARRYVRFAGHAAKRAAMAPPYADPQTVAKDAVIEAAKRFAPGLLANSGGGYGRVPAIPQQSGYPQPSMPQQSGYPSPDSGGTCTSCGSSPHGHRRHGKWVRRGRHIVLLGV